MKKGKNGERERRIKKSELKQGGKVQGEDRRERERLVRYTTFLLREAFKYSNKNA